MIPVALLISLLATTAPATAATTQVWATHPLDNVFQDTPLPRAPMLTVELDAARGQVADAQVVIRTSRDVRVSTLALSPLRSDSGATIPPDSFLWHFIEYQAVKKNSSQAPPAERLRDAPAEFPDAFSDARDMTVKAGRTQPIWVQVKVPQSATAGSYTATLSLSIDAATIRMPVKLTVYDFVLPRPRLWMAIWINDAALAEYLKVKPESDAFWAMAAKTARMMREHHQNVIYTPWQMIKATRGADGKVRLDFSKFDRWVQTFLDNGFEMIEVSHLGVREHGGWEDKEFVPYPMPCLDARGATTQPATLEEWVPALARHLHEKNWEKQTVIHVADEPTAVNFQSWRKVSQRVHRLAPDVRRIDAILTPEVIGELEVMVPLLSYLEMFSSQFQAAQKNGAELWFYTAWVPQQRYPNRLMDFALLKTRVLHWMNYTTRSSGYLHWAWNQWAVPFDTFAPGDNWIVWPGETGPRSSIRYEAERAGVEDYAYLCLLEERAHEAAVRLGARDFDARQWVLAFITDAVPNFQDYTREPGELLKTRQRVARAIEAFGEDEAARRLLRYRPITGPASKATPTTQVAEPRF